MRSLAFALCALLAIGQFAWAAAPSPSPTPASASAPTLASGTDSQSDYAAIFGANYRNALVLLAEVHPVMKNRFGGEGNRLVEAESIIFPELVRFSGFYDILETAGLEYLYKMGGARAADYSIGYFQMKPSFVEELESYISRHAALSAYADICSYSSKSAQKNRVERLRRLKNTVWQVEYLDACIACVMDRFPDLADMAPVERVRFIAAAYNGGFTQSRKVIEGIVNFRGFSDQKFNSGPKYRYTDICAWFYTKRSTGKI